LFSDRFEAGRLLVPRLRGLQLERPIVLALPRGGVPVGLEIARSLHAPLDLVLVRKIGAPDQRELAIGAVSDGERPELVTDARLIEVLGVPAHYVEAEKEQALAEIDRRRTLYLKGRPPLPLHGRAAIVVDDGIATGSTMEAALRATRRRGPARMVVAVPIASRRAMARLSDIADDVVCLDAPSSFLAINQFYEQFPQLRDEEVVQLMEQAAAMERVASTQQGVGHHQATPKAD